MIEAAKPSERDLATQRQKARRTAWGLAAVAALIFVAFFLSGVFGTSPGT